MSWINQQLRIAAEILDNPGGGLVFGYQALGQIQAHLAESGDDRYAPVLSDLRSAERAAVYRDYEEARRLIGSAAERLAGL